MQVEEMSQADYARHRGVSRQAIGKLIDLKKIPYREVGGKKLIDAAAADFALGEARARIDEPPEEDVPAAAAPSESSGLTKARTDNERYKARIAQLDYEQRIGKLLPVDQVAFAMERCAAAIVRDVDQLPNFAEEIAAVLQQGGVPALRAKLKEIARSTRVVLAESMRLAAADDEKPSDTNS